MSGSQLDLFDQGYALKVAISGASGFIGVHLKNYLESRGCVVVPISRKELENQEVLSSLLEQVDVVVNLAGENIGAGYWSKKKKERILESRIFATKSIVSALKPGKVLISASAIGYYGSDAKVFDERAREGNDFLARVCKSWEDAANKYTQGRVVTPRFGVVISKKGGFLQKVIRLAKFGLGGKIGEGQQKMSFIAIEDLVRVLFLCMVDKGFTGPLNVVTPNPISNYDFIKLLSRAVKRPLPFAMPKWLVSLFFGEKGKALLLADQEIFPQKLQKFGYEYLYSTMESLLMD